MSDLISSIDKVKGDYTITISKERLQCLIGALSRGCLSGEDHCSDKAGVVLTFTKIDGHHVVRYQEIGESDYVVLSRWMS